MQWSLASKDKVRVQEVERLPLHWMKLHEMTQMDKELRYLMSQTSKSENEILEPWMRSFHEFGKENKKRKKIKSSLPILWWKKPQEHLYEAWKKKEMDFSLPCLSLWAMEK